MCTEGSAQVSGWQDLPALPKAMAGQCVGRAGNLLVAAGGSTWTKPPWAGGEKHWSNDIYTLGPGDTSWKVAGHLPQALAYGSAVQLGDEMLCIGGQNADHVFSSTLLLRVVSGKLGVETLSSLPQPVTNAEAALVDHEVFLVGGQHTAVPEGVSREIWSFSLPSTRSPGGRWTKAASPPWKHARILPAVAGCGKDLYVFGGADLAAGPQDAPVRTYLKDVWRLQNRETWTRLPDLPAPVTGAPSLCASSGAPIIFGGDDGSLADQIQTLKDRHPGFSRKVLELDPKTGRWSTISELPLSLVTTGAVEWNGMYVIAGGENQPGHRSAKVIGWKR